MKQIEDRLREVLRKEMSSLQADQPPGAWQRRRLRLRFIWGAETLAVLSLALAGFVWLSSSPSKDPGNRSNSQSTAGQDAAVGEFHPDTYLEGDLVVMPITFPDGTTAELAFPDSLELDSYQVRPQVGGGIEDQERGGERETFVLFQGRGWLGEDYFSPIETYEGADGGLVRLVKAPPRDVVDLYLVFEFGSWTVLIPDHRDIGLRLTDEERRQWARSLMGEEAEDGFLLLRAEPPLVLDSATSETLGPRLTFEGGDRTIGLFPGPCQPYASGTEAGFEKDSLVHMEGLVVSLASGSANWCDPNASMIVHVEAKSDSYMREVISELRIRNVHLGTQGQAD